MGKLLHSLAAALDPFFTASVHLHFTLNPSICSVTIDLISVLPNRFVNRLLDMVDFQLLERHSDNVGAWMESSAGVADKLGFEQFEKLYRSEHLASSIAEILSLIPLSFLFSPCFCLSSFALLSSPFMSFYPLLPH